MNDQTDWIVHHAEKTLKVSFFGPFYGSYVIFDLDKEKYQYAYVSGPNRNYLWLLGRTPEIDQKIFVSIQRKDKKSKKRLNTVFTKNC